MPHISLPPDRAAVNLDRVMPFLLAGGRGSRLHELTATECKPALPVLRGPQGGVVRMVDFTLANLFRSGLPRAMAATCYRPVTLMRHLATAWAAGFPQGLQLLDGGRIAPSPGYLGTCHAVAANLSALTQFEPSEVLILSGDHVYEMDYRPMITAHRASGAAVTLAVTRVPIAAAHAFGVIEAAADGMIRDFAEKPLMPRACPDDAGQALISIGVYVARWDWLRDALRACPAKADFGHDLLPMAVRAGVAGWFALPPAPGQTRPFWRDVGSLAALRETLLAFTQNRPPCAVPAPPQALRAGTALHPSRLEPPYGALQYGFSCAIGGLTLRAPRLGALNGRRWTVIEDSLLLPGARPAPGVRLTRAIVAPGTALPAGLVVGEDPEEDGRWFRCSEDGSVLVTSAMLARRGAERPRQVPVSAPHRAAGADPHAAQV